MSSMKFEDRELDHLLKVDPKSTLVRNLRKVDTNEVDVDKSSKDRVHLLAREVLKACNVIRPSVADLTTLPFARK